MQFQHQHDWIDISGPQDREAGRRELICGQCLEERVETAPVGRWDELDLGEAEVRLRDPASASWGTVAEGLEDFRVHSSMLDSLVPFGEVRFHLDWDLPSDAFDQIRQIQLETSVARSGTRGNPFAEGLTARGAIRS